MAKLSQAKIASLEDGLHADGSVTGLYLRVRGIYRSWIFRRSVSGKRYEIGIGGEDLPIAVARKKAAQLRALEGTAFVEAFKSRNAPEVPKLSFSETAEKYLAWRKERGTLSKSVDAMISGFLRMYFNPVIGNMQVSEISEKDVARIVTGMDACVRSIPRALSYLKNIFDWAKASGFRTGDNPADKKGALQFLIAVPATVAENHGALTVEELPEFFALLNGIKNESARLFQFSILTATRSGTARRAKWEDIDLEAGEWSIKPQDLKVSENGGLVVPLPPKVVAFLKNCEPKESGWIFPGRAGSAYCSRTFSNIIEAINRKSGKKWIDRAQSLKLGREVGITQHGIARSTFRTWAQDDELGNDKRFDAVVAELCLHHRIDDKYRGAYERNSFMRRRREMMEAWADYCFSKIEEKK